MYGYTNEVPTCNVDYLPHHLSPHKRTGVTSWYFSFLFLLWDFYESSPLFSHTAASMVPKTPPGSRASLRSAPVATDAPVVEIYTTRLAAVPMFVSFTYAEVDPGCGSAAHQPCGKVGTSCLDHDSKKKRDSKLKLLGSTGCFKDYINYSSSQSRRSCRKMMVQKVTSI